VIYEKPPSIRSVTGKVGYVTNVYTRPEWRGRGVASALMKLIVDFAKDAHIGKLHLGTTELGRGVYTRVGFMSPRAPQLELTF
jgi:GNAT superfamily N-acetyltransferase